VVEADKDNSTPVSYFDPTYEPEGPLELSQPKKMALDFQSSGIRVVRILRMPVRGEDYKEFLSEDRRDELNSLPKPESA